MAIEEQIAGLSKAIVDLNRRLDQLVSAGILAKSGAAAAPAPAPAAAEPAPAKGKGKGKGKPAASEFTLDDIRALCVEVSKTVEEGKDKVIAALQRHGAQRLVDLSPDHFTSMHEMLTKIRDEEYDPRDSDTGEEEDETF